MGGLVRPVPSFILSGSTVSSIVLPYWLLLVPAFTFGLLAYARRARLNQPIPEQRSSPSSTWFGAGLVAFYGLSDVNERLNGDIEQVVTFTMAGVFAFQIATLAAMCGRKAWTALLARAMAEIGLLGYTAALAALLIQGDESGLFEGFFLLGIFLYWLGHHLVSLRAALPSTSWPAAARSTAQ